MVVALHQIALAEIRRVTQDAKLHADIFLARAMDKHQAQLRKELSAKIRECEKGTKRLANLDKLFRKAFEEMTLEHLSNQQFQMLTQGYEVEKWDLSEGITLLEKEIINSHKKKNYTQQVDVYFNFVGRI